MTLLCFTSLTHSLNFSAILLRVITDVAAAAAATLITCSSSPAQFKLICQTVCTLFKLAKDQSIEGKKRESKQPCQTVVAKVYNKLTRK